MSLTIAIQACCQVFQITYGDLVGVETRVASHGFSFFSNFVTERKFTAYYCFFLSAQRDTANTLNMSVQTLTIYRRCIEELIEEDPRHRVIIEAIEAKYNEIQSKRIKAA
jgi:hypothetical protein